jgi:hypothetical protein
MPRKAQTFTDEERTRRIKETAEEIGTSNDLKDFERAFKTVVSAELPEKPSQHKAKKPRKERS